MNKKLWAVKGFVWENVKNSQYKVNHKIRKLTLLAKNLSFQNAKKLCKTHKNMQASIFPNVKEEKLRVIKLS